MKKTKTTKTKGWKRKTWGTHIEKLDAQTHRNK